MESRLTLTSASQSNDNMIVLSFLKNKLAVERSLLIKSSDYFATMFSANYPWQEVNERTVHLDHWRPSHFVSIIRSLKTRNPSGILSQIKEFFPTIHYFGITPLLNSCVEHKVAQLSNENVLDELRFAQFYSLPKLYDGCMEHLFANIATFLAQPRLNREMPKELFLTIINHEKLVVANEDAVLSLIDRWCSIDGRKSDRVQLLEGVRFAHLTLRAFNECRRDEQCLEVAKFRALIESSRWSDLDESCLVGRAYSQVHMHSIWASKDNISDQCFPYAQLQNPSHGVDVFVSCSANGGKTLFSDSCSGQYASIMMYPSHSASFGGQLFFYEPFMGDFYLEDHPLIAIGAVLGFPDWHSPEPSVCISFEKATFAVAPPVVVAGDLYIPHVACKPGQIFDLDTIESQRLNPKNFQQLEVLRYHFGEDANTTVVSATNLAWCDFSASLLVPENNKLCVREDWKMLLIPNSGLLLAIDRQPASGPIIRLPKEHWRAEYGDFATFSDMVISDDKAYIALEFISHDEVVSSVLVYDLPQGKLLQKIDLSSIFFDRSPVPEFREFELYLREIQNQIYILAFTKHIDGGARGFTYRLQLSADDLKVVSVMNDFDINENEFLEYGGEPIHRLEGRQVSVDAHPCWYASALQYQAHMEADPIRLEKLRKYTW